MTQPSILIRPLMLLATLAMPAMPALAGGVANAASAAVTVEQAADTLEPGRFVWADEQPLGEPLSIIVSIAEQKAYVYRGPALVAVSTVSTGKVGKDTPAGTFPILQKKEMHRSNLYNDAPMPFMQRLTWDGIALHAGKNPGFPASHGCIRLPTEFARKLFAATTLGTTVTVTDDYATSAIPAAAAYDQPADAGVGTAYQNVGTAY